MIHTWKHHYLRLPAFYKENSILKETCNSYPYLIYVEILGFQESRVSEIKMAVNGGRL